MKYSRFIFSTLVLFFGFFLVVFSAFKLSPGASAVNEVSKGFEQALSNTEGTNPPTVSADRQAGGRDTEELEIIELGDGVDYYLPYPGILPDHPLYWLKMVRDRVRLWMTRDVEAKYERLLLYADKRVGAARALVEGGQADLGVTTATKAEKYLEQTVDQFEKVKEKGRAYPERIENLQRAIAKHEEVLREVKEKVPDQVKPALDQVIEKAAMLQERVEDKFK